MNEKVAGISSRQLPEPSSGKKEEIILKKFKNQKKKTKPKSKRTTNKNDGFFFFFFFFFSIHDDCAGDNTTIAIDHASKARAKQHKDNDDWNNAGGAQSTAEKGARGCGTFSSVDPSGDRGAAIPDWGAGELEKGAKVAG